MRVTVFDLIRVHDFNLYAFQMSIQEIIDKYDESVELDDSTKSYVSRSLTRMSKIKRFFPCSMAKSCRSHWNME